MKVRIEAADGPTIIELSDKEFMRMWFGVDVEATEAMYAPIQPSAGGQIMDPNSGRTFNLSDPSDLIKADKLLQQGGELVPIRPEDISKLKNMNRTDRRKALKEYPRLQRKQLAALLKEMNLEK